MKFKPFSIFPFLLLLELCILSFSVFSLFQPNKVYSYIENDLQSDRANTIYTLATPAIILARGSYDIDIEYQCSSDSVTLSVTSAYGSTMATDDMQDISLSPNSLKISLPLTTSSAIHGFQLQFSTNSSDALEISSVKIAENNSLKRSSFVALFSLCLLINAVFFLYKRYWLKIDQKSRLIYFALLTLGLLISIPALDSYAITGHDLEFHLVRIEELKDSLLNLQFPSRIQGGWLNKAGYAVSIFYGDIFLYFPALLRICGFSMSTAYNSYIILFNFLTIFLSYYSFRNIFKNKYLGLTGSFLYSTSFYRLTNIYVRSAVGEYTAFTFLPLIALGLYRIFTEDPKNDHYKHNWLLPALGYSGLVQSHVLSCEIAGFFTLVTCLILFKRALYPARFMVLLKTVIATFFVNAGFLIPFLDYMRGKYNFNDNTINRMIQSKGVFLSDLFIPFPHIGGRATTAADRLYSATPMPASIGLPLITVILLFFMLLLCQKMQKKEPLWQACSFCTILALIAMWMTTCLFPWDSLYQANKFMTILVKSLQFPWRILGIVTLLLVLASGFLILQIRNRLSLSYAKYTFTTLWILGLLSSSWFISNLHDNIFYTNYTSNTLSHSLIGKGEYLPQGTDKEELLTFSGSFPESVKLSEMTHNYGKVIITCANTSNTPQDIEIPLLYYPYFQAEDISNGDKFEVSSGNNNVIKVTIPPEYNGTLFIAFHEPLLWRVSEVMSLITILTIIIMILRYHHLPIIKFSYQES